MSELVKFKETARALEIVLARVKLDPQTAYVIKSQLANARERVEIETAAAVKLREEGPWPNGCIKRASCARNKRCMYGMNGRCRHEGRAIAEEVEAAA